MPELHGDTHDVEFLPLAVGDRGRHRGHAARSRRGPRDDQAYRYVIVNNAINGIHFKFKQMRAFAACALARGGRNKQRGPTGPATAPGHEVSRSQGAARQGWRVCLPLRVALWLRRAQLLRLRHVRRPVRPYTVCSHIRRRFQQPQGHFPIPSARCLKSQAIFIPPRPPKLPWDYWRTK